MLVWPVAAVYRDADGSLDVGLQKLGAAVSTVDAARVQRALVHLATPKHSLVTDQFARHTASTSSIHVHVRTGLHVHVCVRV